MHQSLTKLQLFTQQSNLDVDDTLHAAYCCALGLVIEPASALAHTEKR